MRRVGSVVIALVFFGIALPAQQQTPPQTAQTPPQTPPAPTAPAPTTGSSRVIQKLIVKVNGEPFTQTDYEKELVTAIRDKRPNVADFQETQRDPALIAMVRDLTPDILVDNVDNLLLYQHGKELGYKLSDENFRS